MAGSFELGKDSVPGVVPEGGKGWEVVSNSAAACTSTNKPCGTCLTSFSLLPEFAMRGDVASAKNLSSRACLTLGAFTALLLPANPG